MEELMPSFYILVIDKLLSKATQVYDFCQSGDNTSMGLELYWNKVNCRKHLQHSSIC